MEARALAWAFLFTMVKLQQRGKNIPNIFSNDLIDCNLRKVYSFLFFTLLLCMLNTGSFGQDVVQSRNTLWTECYVLGKIVPKWEWQMEFHYRRTSSINEANLFERPAQHLYRPWVHFSPYKWLRFSFSPIAYIVSFNQNNLLVSEPELRLSLQAMFIKKYGSKLTIHHRFRYEMRQFGKRDVVDGSEFSYRNMTYDFPYDADEPAFGVYAGLRHRYRYMLRGIYPLGNRTSIERNTWYLTFWDELFFTSGGQHMDKEWFDQNRIFGLFGYRIDSDLPMRITFGYGYRFVVRNNYLSNEHITINEHLHTWLASVWIDDIGVIFKKKENAVPKP